ncbi:TrbI/VirB10 family protein [Caulobacter radicis]|uniref:Conjugal transfer protein TrbI n=1 Tax=Caulobacter radicis TaxID=2172650 RepID=A0A2T9J7H4_9CAUL|nr:TrbI/VirB10 family protein [Caulobacter radicis]PVM77480.1 conjugal transfer protein TrbI [Caulobacter radicis]
MSTPSNRVDQQQAQIAKALRLRGPNTPVARVSRKTLMVVGAALSLALAAAVGWSLTERAPKPAPEPPSSPPPPPAERISSLPKDYLTRGDPPKLGPPLPGDLGRPILSAQGAQGAQGAGGAGFTPDQATRTAGRDLGLDPALAARQAERQAARASAIFLQVRAEPASSSAPALEVKSMSTPGADDRAVSPERLQAPGSPYILQAGSIIPAALITGLRSDVPGLAIAQVTDDVHDSLGGGYLLIPAGSKLIGTYATTTSSGQSRLGVAWTRLILPSGRSILLDKLPASDAQGMAGLQDGVDRHWRAVWSAAGLSTVLSIGAQAGAADEDDLSRAIRRAVSGVVSDVGQQAVGRNLALAPTLKIRPGTPLRILLSRDLVLEPYAGDAR